eukprot:CAMPEP_0117650104 /NCGR_PEP_ID=MMETSP0804-20121206/1360_1 /TAXON_ID=1074897 /ORGANISM="Tetraselmis astigmatica, Strain CCMP880" /LENGTH=139 /DNA_ID=CAMNT_0005455951 /DNA_START=985 /DNA_END=1402 /DNA_ORIENTATION=-
MCTSVSPEADQGPLDVATIVPGVAEKLQTEERGKRGEGGGPCHEDCATADLGLPRPPTRPQHRTGREGMRRRQWVWGAIGEARDANPAGRRALVRRAQARAGVRRQPQLEDQAKPQTKHGMESKSYACMQIDRLRLCVT